MEFSWRRIGIISQKHTDRIWKYTREAVEEVVTGAGMLVAVSREYNAATNDSLRAILQDVAKSSRSMCQNDVFLWTYSLFCWKCRLMKNIQTIYRRNIARITKLRSTH